MYTADLSTIPGVTIATFAVDTADLASDKDPERASDLLQDALNKVHNWLQDWRIKANAAKSAQITFTNRKYLSLSSAKYLEFVQTVA